MFFSKLFTTNTLKYATPIFRRLLTTTKCEVANRPKLHFVPQNSWIYQQNDKIQHVPSLNNVIRLPNNLFWVPPLREPENRVEIVAPTTERAQAPKEAVRMIVIRRRKMRRHKLRKLRKKMKFEWAKRRQKREFLKEKAFQAILIKRCKEAESFSAELYVNEKLNKLHEIIIPKFWKGKRLPEFIVREKMGLPPKEST